MHTRSTPQPPTFADMIASQQPRLVRLCAHLAVDTQAAEDLAQETLLIAWRQRHHLSDPSGFAHWLNAIARNVCRHHVRGQRRAAAHLAHSAALDEADMDTMAEIEKETQAELAADFDLEVELERSELISLLDRALGLLPPESRGLLVQHYLEELPQAELATRLGLSSGALAVRLHRGKLALRRTLITDFSDEAIALGLVAPEAMGWRPTRIWCFYCGQRYLEARFNQTEGHLRLRCPGCCNPHDTHDFVSNASTPLLHNFKTVKPALNFSFR